MPIAEITIDTRPPHAFGLLWRDCGRRNTSQGPRYLYEATPTDEFTAAWKRDKARLRDGGYGFGRGIAGDWVVNFWARPTAAAVQETAQATAAAVEASRATDAALATALATQGWAISKANWDRARTLAACDDLTGSECNEAFALIACMAANVAKAADPLKGEVVESAYADRAADPEVREVALEACRWLAARDADRAVEENGVGYGKDTSSLGHALAAKDSLDEHDAAVALGVLWTHRRQLGQDTLDRLFGEVAAAEGRPTPAPAFVEVATPVADPEPEVEVVEVPVPPVPAEPVDAVEPVHAAAPTVAQERLRRAGELTYGPRWQTDLARDLDLADRTVRRYATGAVPVPDDLWPRITEVIRARRAAMDAFLGELSVEALVVQPAPPPAAPVRRSTELPEPGVGTVDYVAGHVRALTVDRQRRAEAQWALIPTDDRAYMDDHWHELQLLGHGVSGVAMLVADHDAELDVINRVAAIVGASADAAVAAGRKPAWLSAAQADAAIEQAASTPTQG